MTALELAVKADLITSFSKYIEDRQIGTCKPGWGVSCRQAASVSRLPLHH